MDRKQFYDAIAPHETFITALAWHGYKHQGRGAVIVEFDAARDVNNIWYCVTDETMPSEQVKDMIKEYEPTTDVCIVGLQESQHRVSVARYTPRIPPEVAEKYSRDIFEYTPKTGMFNSADVVM